MLRLVVPGREGEPVRGRLPAAWWWLTLNMSGWSRC